jgi:hypothetical protein
MATLAFRDGTVHMPADLIKYSIILKELSETFAGDEEALDMVCGTREEARRAIAAFETIVRILPDIETFNAPEGRDVGELEAIRVRLRDAHTEIVALTRDNEVYEWLGLFGDAARALRTLEDEAFPFPHLRDKNLVIYVDHARWSFENDCLYRGCLPVARWLYSLGALTFWLTGPLDFEKACEFGSLSVAQWLYSLGVNVHHVKDSAFCRACTWGRLPTAQWLYGLGVDIHANDGWPYRGALNNEHFAVVEWLRELGCGP